MIDTYEVVKKLIGKIEPIGDPFTDKERLENLQKITSLVDALLDDIGNVSKQHRISSDGGMRRSGVFAHNFFVHRSIKIK